MVMKHTYNRKVTGSHPWRNFHFGLCTCQYPHCKNHVDDLSIFFKLSYVRIQSKSALLIQFQWTAVLPMVRTIGLSES